ncbi:transposase/DNA replication protein DnaC [Bradyrhizobium sp. USDA 4486]
MQTDYAGPTVEVIDPQTGEIRQAQIFVAVLGASSLTFAMGSFGQRLPDWIEGQTRALSYFGGVPKAIVCDNLKAGVVKALWFEPTLNQTFAAMAEHYDTTILPTRSRKPRDKGKVEGAVLIVERWILARLRHRRFFNLTDLNTAIGGLLEELNHRPMRHIGKSRRQLFEEIERAALTPLPSEPFEYAEWKTAKVHPDYHVEVDKTFYSVPHRLIGRRVDVRLTYRAVEIFQDHTRVASHVRRSQRSGHVTVNEHMPKAHQRYANMTPASLIKMAARVGVNAATLVERMMRERPHPEQGYRSAMGIIALARRYERNRLEAACERALAINAINYSSVSAILKSGLDRASPAAEPIKATPSHANHPWRRLLSMKERNIAMLTHPTLEQMQALGLAGMAAAYRQLAEQDNAADLSRDEWLGLMLDREAAMRADRRLTNRLAAAKLRFVDACIEDVDFASRRGLDRRNTLQLAQGAWLKAHENFIITGLTGTGKTWLACAFGRQAARLDHSVLYLRMPRLFEDLAMARLDGRFPRLIDKLARVQLLILDDWGTHTLNDQQRLADSARCRPPFRNDLAHRSDLISPTIPR